MKREDKVQNITQPATCGFASLLLVHPPQPFLLEGFSSGLVALASYVSRVLPAVKVCLLDTGRMDKGRASKELAHKLGDLPRRILVGVTTTTASYQSALGIAETVKAISPHSSVVFGGHHVTSQADVVLESHPAVDFIVRGEGEQALTTLLHDFPRLDAVPNLSYRRDGGIIHNPPGPLLDQTDLDKIGITFDGMNVESVPGKFDHVTYVSARGCPLRCAFCSVANERIRSKSTEAVIRDLRILAGHMGYRSIAIEDNFFAHSPKRTLDLCHAIERLQHEVRFKWDCQTRVESCQREDVILAMERAGCEAVYLGVESLNPEHLRYLNKTRHPETYLELLHQKVLPRLLRSRIEIYLNLQLGLPRETQYQRDEVINQLKALGRQALTHSKTITIFPQLHVVYPGTQHFQQALNEGRFGLEGKKVFEKFTEWESRKQPVLRWLGEHFAHGTGGIPEGILNLDQLRRGRFEVNPDAVLDITNQLNAIDNIPGISIFRYGRYLTAHESNAPGIAPLAREAQ